MRRVLATLWIAGALALNVPSPARAFHQNSPDIPATPLALMANQPAATLLLPYFEVEHTKKRGATTIFTINNAFASAQLTHVTVWSDLGVPVLGFNLYLTGYDSQTIDMRDILNGVLPRTASAGQDPGNLISPRGPESQDLNFPGCFGILPIPPLDPAYIPHLKNSLTGQFSEVLGGCAGLSYRDRIARGYVTVDAVNACALLFPSDPGYFISGGFGIAANTNALWGDFFYVNPTRRISHGDALVHIRADGTDTETSVAGEYSFYGRYVAWTAADNRQPLSTGFAARFWKRGVAPLRTTSLIVWRDFKKSQNAFSCATKPPWYPLSQEAITVFNEEEEPFIMPTSPVSPPLPSPALLPFPAATQRVQVGSRKFPVSFNAGWLWLDLNTSIPVSGSNPPEDPTAAQAWVYAVQDSIGRLSIGHRATQLDSAMEAEHDDPGGF